MGFHAGDHAFIVFRPRPDAPLESRYIQIMAAERNGNTVTYTFQCDGQTTAVPNSHIFKSHDKAEEFLFELNNIPHNSRGRKRSVERTNISPVQTLLMLKRRQLCLTQNQTSELAGISLRQYQRLESGERDILNASYRSARAVFRVLGITDDELDTILQEENDENRRFRYPVHLC